MVERFAPGPRMSRVVKHSGVAHLAGMTAEDASLDFAGQIKQVLDKADAALALAGTSRSNLLTATIWLSDMSYFAEMNAIWEKWIDPRNPPARATAECKLARPTLLVEILFTAAC
jgi:enamine deaminase RidA (YjgF/YER057c/UK114 family)